MSPRPKRAPVTPPAPSLAVSWAASYERGRVDSLAGHLRAMLVREPDEAPIPLAAVLARLAELGGPALMIAPAGTAAPTPGPRMVLGVRETVPALGAQRGDCVLVTPAAPGAVDQVPCLFRPLLDASRGAVQAAVLEGTLQPDASLAYGGTIAALDAWANAPLPGLRARRRGR